MVGSSKGDDICVVMKPGTDVEMMLKSVYLNDAAGSGQGSRPPSKGLSSVYLQPNQNDGIEEYDLSAAPSYYYQTYQAPSFTRKDQEPAPVVEVAKEGQMSQAKPAEQQQIVTAVRT
ncbi:hypothetical protein GCK32_008300 [Trichostrongylus colubriformis]|uniref:Uncharacterized protein n=1 Tax=Trichostrongylus colubriformis TaxID=6319 RepID=A0AAN8FNY1_TRICO